MAYRYLQGIHSTPRKFLKFSAPAISLHKILSDSNNFLTAENGLKEVGIKSHTAEEEQAVSCVVSGAHALILRISSYLGLAPLHFEPHGAGYLVTISRAKCTYSYALITALITLTIYGLVAEICVGVELSVKMTSRMSQFVCSCDILVIVFTTGAGVYGAPDRMRNMLKYMESMASVDASLGAHYSMWTERKLCAMILAFLSFFSALNVADFCFYVVQAQKLNRQWYIVLNSLGFYLLWFVLVVLELQFALTVVLVGARFRALNDVLGHVASQLSAPEKNAIESSPLNIFAVQVAVPYPGFDNGVGLLVDTMPGTDRAVIIRRASGEPTLLVPPYEAVRRAASLQGALCCAARGVCHEYGLPLVAILLSTLLHLIETPYLLLMEIVASKQRVYFMVLLFLWCIIHVVRVCLVVEPCHRTTAEGKRMDQMVCSMLSEAPLCSKLSARLQQFSQQLALQAVSYAPMGMCTLDRPLLVTILGAVATYLVILIQFQRNND